MDFLLRLLEISLTSVWSFLGALILLLVAGGLIVLFVGQIVMMIVDRNDRAERRLQEAVRDIIAREGLESVVRKMDSAKKRDPYYL